MVLVSLSSPCFASNKAILAFSFGQSILFMFYMLKYENLQDYLVPKHLLSGEWNFPLQLAAVTVQVREQAVNILLKGIRVDGQKFLGARITCFHSSRFYD